MRASRRRHPRATRRPPATAIIPFVAGGPESVEIDGVRVALIAWPTGDARRQALAAAQRPRLLLVEGDLEPPESDDRLEDWLCLPRDFDDIGRRARRLVRLARRVA